jgi:hypothetical protein
MIIAVRMNITNDQGSRTCLVNAGENCLHSVPALAIDSGDIAVPEKGYLLGAGGVGALSHSRLSCTSVSVLPCSTPRLRVCVPV